MAKPDRMFRQVTAKVIPIYHCAKCNLNAEGSIATLQVTALCETAQGIMQQLSYLPISNNHMPQGWSGMGMDKHYCPDCKHG